MADHYKGVISHKKKVMQFYLHVQSQISFNSGKKWTKVKGLSAAVERPGRLQKAISIMVIVHLKKSLNV